VDAGYDDTPILVLSTEKRFRDQELGRDCRADRVVVKPSIRDQLVEIVSKFDVDGARQLEGFGDMENGMDFEETSFEETKEGLDSDRCRPRNIVTATTIRRHGDAVLRAIHSAKGRSRGLRLRGDGQIRARVRDGADAVRHGTLSHVPISRVLFTAYATCGENWSTMARSDRRRRGYGDSSAGRRSKE